MKRLLCIISALDAGGAETFLMKLYRNMDTEKYQMDFCAMSDTHGFYEDEAIERGSKVFHVERKSRNPIKCFLDIRRVVKENGYEYAIRVNEHSLSVVDLIACRAGGAKVLAMRSSNASTPGRLGGVLHKIFKFLPKCVPNVKIAPSTEAAVYTFGKNCVKDGKVKLLHNGLVHETYRFNAETRQLLRSQLQLDDKLVVGHVGRFNLQKNHKFLIDIFKDISDKNEDARLVLAGIGKLEAEIKEKVNNLKLDDKVIFLGRRSDVPQLMSAFDVMAFPSFYEGMPNVIIEAQAAGLPCVISDSITPEADITGLVKYMPLSASSAEWADCVLNSASVSERCNTFDIFREQEYDIQSVTDKFIRLVFEGATE